MAAACLSGRRGHGSGCSALGRAVPFVTGWYNIDFGHVFFWPLAWGAVLALVMTLRLRRQAVL